MSEYIDQSLKKAAKGTTFIFVGTIASSLLLLATKVLIVRHTTKEEFGIYSLSVAITTIITLLATFGIFEGVARYVAIYVGKGERSEADRVARSALKIGIITGFIAGTLLFFGARILSTYIFNLSQLTVPLQIVAVSIPFYVLSHIMIGVLRGYGLIASRVYFLDVGLPLVILLFLLFNFFVGLPFITLVVIYSLSIVLISISIAYSYRRTAGTHPFDLTAAGKGKELFKFSVPLLVGTVMTLVFGWTDSLMLGRYAGAQSVGVYDVSSSFAKLLNFPLAALEFVFLPIAGAMFAQQQMLELKRTYQVLTKWVFLATVPIFAMLFVFSEPAIALFFGSRFNDAVPPFRILAIGFLFHAAMGANGILMVVIGLSREIMAVSIAGAVLNIVLNYLLIRVLAFGILGAAMATVLTYVVLNVVVSIIVYRKARIHPITVRYLKSTVSVLAAGLVLAGGTFLVPVSIWMLPVFFPIFLVTLGIMLLVTKSVDHEDVSLFHAIAEKTGIKKGLFSRWG